MLLVSAGVRFLIGCDDENRRKHAFYFVEKKKAAGHLFIMLVFVSTMDVDSGSGAKGCTPAGFSGPASLATLASETRVLTTPADLDHS